MQYQISLFLDKRFRKNSGLFPIKLRVYSVLIQKAKLYTSGIDVTEDHFTKLLDNQFKVRGKNKNFRQVLNNLESKAEDVANGLDPFTFQSFEDKFLRKKNASLSVKYHYDNKINDLKQNRQISTGSNYELSLLSITRFLIDRNFQIEQLTFFDITPRWLQDYENFMVITKGRSRTTVSIYLRALRTIFNDAIAENDIKKDIYPFGKAKNKYQVPNTKGKKKALTKVQLGILFKQDPKTKEQEIAKDYWFFSYSCNGANIKDILQLRWKDLDKDSINYYRAKTLNTGKGNLKQIKVYLNSYTREIIAKYSTRKNSPEDYIFPILNLKEDATDSRRKIKNFTSFINSHFNKLAISAGFDFKISTYWARHSFATVLIRNGASMEFVSEALNHSNLNVTKSYFAGFEDETKKDIAKTLMDF